MTFGTPAVTNPQAALYVIEVTDEETGLAFSAKPGNVAEQADVEALYEKVVAALEAAVDLTVSLTCRTSPAQEDFTPTP